MNNRIQIDSYGQGKNYFWCEIRRVARTGIKLNQLHSRDYQLYA